MLNIARLVSQKTCRHRSLASFSTVNYRAKAASSQSLGFSHEDLQDLPVLDRSYMKVLEN